MNNSPQTSKAKKEIIMQIADLSKLLGLIPGNETVRVNEPLTHHSMELSKWFDETRKSFLRLSIQIDKALGLNLS